MSFELKLSVRSNKHWISVFFSFAVAPGPDPDRRTWSTTNIVTTASVWSRPGNGVGRAREFRCLSIRRMNYRNDSPNRKEMMCCD